MIVSIGVKNIGEYDGSETVQCYVKDKVAQIARPLRELKGHNHLDHTDPDTLKHYI